MPRCPILVLIALAACVWVSIAQAQNIRRCTARDGSMVITDKPCAAIDATDRLPPRSSAATANLRPTQRMVCARTLDALSYEVASAIDMQDANRLAGVYHWVGMGGENAYRIFTRLESLVKRPLVDIGPYGGGDDAEPVWRQDADGNLIPAPPKPRPPSGLKIEQSLGRDGIRSTRTVFGLRRHLGCLWISY